MIKKEFYEKQAGTIIKNMKIRGIDGYYCADKEEACKLALSLMPEGSSIGWGGSVTIDEIGLKAAIADGSYVLYDRNTAANEQEKREIYAKIGLADFFLMSTNAITIKGELVNIDGAGNRLASLLYGPDKVIVIAGMNKVVTTVEEGINRVKNIAAPPNGVRLGKQTPCALTGICGECYGADCMCSHTVITRKSNVKGRIQVILVGEELGY